MSEYVLYIIDISVNSVKDRMVLILVLDSLIDRVFDCGFKGFRLEFRIGSLLFFLFS